MPQETVLCKYALNPQHYDNTIFWLSLDADVRIKVLSALDQIKFEKVTQPSINRIKLFTSNDNSYSYYASWPKFERLVQSLKLVIEGDDLLNLNYALSQSAYNANYELFTRAKDLVQLKNTGISRVPLLASSLHPNRDDNKVIVLPCYIGDVGGYFKISEEISNTLYYLPGAILFFGMLDAMIILSLLLAPAAITTSAIVVTCVGVAALIGSIGLFNNASNNLERTDFYYELAKFEVTPELAAVSPELSF